MKDLRKQLSAAREEYEKIEYPGDLAQEILGAKLSPFRWLKIAVPLAAAAAIAFAVLRPSAQISSPTPAQIDSPIAVNTPQPVEVKQEVAIVVMPTTQKSVIAAVTSEETETDFVVAPSMPQDMAITPDFQSISFDSVPSFPSYDSAEQQSTEDNSTSKEQV